MSAILNIVLKYMRGMSALHSWQELLNAEAVAEVTSRWAGTGGDSHGSG